MEKAELVLRRVALVNLATAKPLHDYNRFEQQSCVVLRTSTA